MHMKRKFIYVYGSLILISSLLVGVTLAVFSDTSNVLGATFTTGSVDIKFLSDPSIETDPLNYVDELSGPNFSGIGTTWQKDYPMKIINNGSSRIALTTHSDYETVNDPKDLRSDILVEIISWSDIDKDGQLDLGEEGTSIGKKTITKWKTEGFSLGEYDAGQIIPLILRFTAPTLTGTQQGATGVFDFIFSSIQI